jgi:hypothetical protein
MSLAGRFAAAPLLHFVLLGAAIFAIDHAIEAHARRQVHVSAEVVDRLVDLWRGQALREPDAAERQSLIEAHVREEILYREARALGLDRDDAIVRRRLAQKLDFLSEDIGEVDPPDEAALQAYYGAHADQYRTPARVTFVHVFFAGADAESRATAALRGLLAAGNDADAWRSAGDPFMLRREYAQRPLAEVDDSFAGGFAAALAAAPLGTWTGPVASGYGLHLVRVDARLEPELPPLADVRDAVAADWAAAQRQQRNAAHYARLRARYRVVIDDPARAAGAAPAGAGTAATAGSAAAVPAHAAGTGSDDTTGQHAASGSAGAPERRDNTPGDASAPAGTPR